MKRKSVRISILVAIFLVSIIITSLIINKGEDEVIKVDSQASFPIIYMDYKGDTVNCLQGYVKDMEPLFFRDTLIPIDPKDKEVSFSINYGENVTAGTYEVKSLDGAESIEKGEISGISGGSETKCSISISEKLENEKEYLLIFNLDNSGETLHYYTRIITDTEQTFDKMYGFVKEFHNKTFSKGEEDYFANFLETDGSEDLSSLESVNIKSSVINVMWGKYNPQISREPVYKIVEYLDGLATVEAEYMVKLEDEKGSQHEYYVDEFYRVCYFDAKLYLLDYKRNLSQVFVPTEQVVSANKINLGIRNGDIDYKTNASNKFIAFVQNGELYAYDRANNKLITVFSYSDPNGFDDRLNNRNHNIKILKIDESGNMDFVLYGYFNMGIHEGETGLIFYHYNNATMTNEEQVFVASDIPYQVIANEVGDLAYVNGENKLIMMLNRGVYEIDFNKKKSSLLIEKLNENTYALSKDESIIAWQEENSEYNSTTISVLDLESHEKYDVTCGENERIKPIGFIGDDFVYGLANASDVDASLPDSVVFPMKKLFIVNQNEIVKEYDAGSYYITSAYVENARVFIKRGVQNGSGGFDPATDDSIINNEAQDPQKVEIKTVSDSVIKRQYQISVDSSSSMSKYSLAVGKEIELDGSTKIMGDYYKDSDDTFLVYSGSKLMLLTAKESQAVKKAEETSGVVINKNKIIWIDGRRDSQNDLSIYNLPDNHSDNSMAACLSMILQAKGKNVDCEYMLKSGKSVQQVLEGNFDCNVLELVGCSLDSMLNFISDGYPVIAVDSAGDAVLIVQYDIFNISVIDPVKNSKYKISLSDAKDLFEKSGNVFVTYIEDK